MQKHTDLFVSVSSLVFLNIACRRCIAKCDVFIFISPIRLFFGDAVTTY